MSKIWKDKLRVYYCEDCNKEVRIKSVTAELVAKGLCLTCNTERVMKYYNDIAIDILAKGNHD